jgi:hypothetical protein
MGHILRRRKCRVGVLIKNCISCLYLDFNLKYNTQLMISINIKKTNAKSVHIAKLGMCNKLLAQTSHRLHSSVISWLPTPRCLV